VRRLLPASSPSLLGLLRNELAPDEASARRLNSAFPAGQADRQFYYGACSWTDRTLIDSGTFYPSSVKTAADRLAHYASQFPIVEVDATYYALPSERNAHLWVDRTPPGFVFNIKAFGLGSPGPRIGRASHA
jgi:hypothetical protein